jgi:hypothetical protein
MPTLLLRAVIGELSIAEPAVYTGIVFVVPPVVVTAVCAAAQGATPQRIIHAILLHLFILLLPSTNGN